MGQRIDGWPCRGVNRVGDDPSRGDDHREHEDRAWKSERVRFRRERVDVPLLGDVKPAARARDTVARLQAQRDEAQSAVGRISKERDEALHEIYRLRSELGGPRTPLSTIPPPAVNRRDPNSALAAPRHESTRETDRPTPSPAPLSPRGRDESQPATVSSVLSPPRSNPNAAPLPTRLSPPPTRLSRPTAKDSSPDKGKRTPPVPATIAAPTSSHPPLKQKPDVNTRPLIGYSMTQEAIEPERVESARQAAPPGSGKR